MKRHNPVEVVNMKYIDGFSSQGWLVVTQTNQILGEAQVVHHWLLTTFQTGPENEVGTSRIVAELLVFQKLLPHEKHGDTGRSQEQAENNPGAASGIPGAGIRGIGQARNARAFANLDDVVILGALDCPPGVAQARCLQMISHPVHIHKGALTRRRLAKDGPYAVAQSVMPCRIKSGSARRVVSNHRRIDWPVLGNLNSAWLDETAGIR